LQWPVLIYRVAYFGQYIGRVRISAYGCIMAALPHRSTALRTIWRAARAAAHFADGEQRFHAMVSRDFARS
jgi:hypothetical protein